MEIKRNNYHMNDESKLYNPYLLNKMQQALDRIIYAINYREKIVIYGGYGFDSIAGISILFLVLKYLNADVEYFIPDYMENENEINVDSINNNVKYLGAGLLITVGCGSNSKKAIEQARNLGIDVIVTDYHKMLSDDIGALVLNPNSKDCQYPFKLLSSAGIIFKLCEAISAYYTMKCIYKYSDLAMLGTLSSMLSIEGENKTIISMGLSHLSRTKNYGIKALLKINKIEKITLDQISNLVNQINPSNNLRNKTNNARIIVELFTTVDSYKAEQISKYLMKELTLSNIN